MKIIKQENYDNVFPYIAYVPDALSSNPALIIQLHGMGERGNGGKELDKVLVHGLSKIANDENLKDCILIMPQCPLDTFWVARIESLKRFVDEMIEKYSIDTKRLYLCGLSMGGFGTWYMGLAYPELFTAIAPCCGGGMPPWRSDLLTMPIWAFHGLDDDIVSPRHTIEMIDALVDCNPNLKCDLYEGVAHNSWDIAFREELINWFLSYKKAE
jgi:predicted peptidase